jgi:hypothetical protein
MASLIPPKSLLDRVEVASPCSAAWEEMAGDDRVRFCAHCNLNVYNLSAMSRREAEAFVSPREGRTCIRFYRRADGTMLTENCPVGWRKARQRLKLVVGGLTAAVAGLVSLWLPARPPSPAKQADRQVQKPVPPQPPIQWSPNRTISRGWVAGAMAAPPSGRSSRRRG